jgi:TolA-binding protein
VHVAVFEGRVRVKGGPRVIELSAGQHWSSDESEKAAPMSEELARALQASRDGRSGPTPVQVFERQAEADERRYQEAEGHARAGRVAEASVLYEAIAAGSGAQAELALYSLAKLEQVASPSRARRLFEAYRRRFPGGVLAQEAALGLLEVHEVLGDKGAAQVEAKEFLEAFPRSERHDEVALMLAKLQVEAGRCEEALPGLARLVPDGTLGEEALFLSAVCAKQSGALGEAHRLGLEYEGRFPSGRFRREVSRLRERE